MFPNGGGGVNLLSFRGSAVPQTRLPQISTRHFLLAFASCSQRWQRDSQNAEEKNSIPPQMASNLKAKSWFFTLPQIKICACKYGRCLRTIYFLNFNYSNKRIPHLLALHFVDAFSLHTIFHFPRGARIAFRLRRPAAAPIFSRICTRPQYKPSVWQKLRKMATVIRAHEIMAIIKLGTCTKAMLYSTCEPIIWHFQLPRFVTSQLQAISLLLLSSHSTWETKFFIKIHFWSCLVQSTAVLGWELRPESLANPSAARRVRQGERETESTRVNNRVWAS